MKYSIETKNKILSAYENDEDWHAFARALDVNVNTAREWIRNFDKMDVESNRKHGGFRGRKLDEAVVDDLLSWISDNPCMTLGEMQLKLKAEYDKDVCLSTINNYLDGRFITIKKVRRICETANSEENLDKRRRYDLHNHFLNHLLNPFPDMLKLSDGWKLLGRPLYG
ncbi:MAG: hypothetical protein ABW094_05040 [Candidatus Thiodiazotropha sp.]